MIFKRCVVIFPVAVAIVAALSLQSCSNSSTEINTPAKKDSNNVNTSGGFVQSLANMTRNGGKVVVGTPTMASDIFWRDSAGTERSFLTEAHGRIGFLCFGGLWNAQYTDPMFDIIDSLQDFYGADSLVTLRVYTADPAPFPLSQYADTIAAHHWKGRFVVDSARACFDNYLPLHNTDGAVPFEVVVDRSGRVASQRTGVYFGGMNMYRKMIDSVKLR